MNDKNHRFCLETPRITGHRQQKFTCPHCGRPKCFVRYVDTHNQCRYLADDVGKCDHQNSCGYHRTPKQYFSDTPEAREAARLSHGSYTPPPMPPLQPLAYDLVDRYHSPQSVFWQWFTGDAAQRLGLSAERIRQVYEAYHIGATGEGDVVFWQIDEKNRVHSGHIMQYLTTGKRDGRNDWVHNTLKEQKLLPSNWQLYQCHFGQHLLALRPDAHVCLVESEKTAVVMAALCPDYLWLATAGCGGMSAGRLSCLRGRRLTVFPDAGCYDRWLDKLQQTSGIDYTISKHLETYPPNTDLVDVLLPPTEQSIDFHSNKIQKIS